MDFPRRRPRYRPSRARRPLLEGLEGRVVLFATNGGSWVNPAFVTYSFIPDGTSIGGISSNLFSSMNAKFSTAAWQKAFQDAAAVWEAVANINVVQVPDDGSAIGVAGSQQGDPRFGDIRIGGYAQSPNILAQAYSPPPLNGGTDAGDMFFNTTQSWQVNGTTYDLETVAIHEFGHALGLSHSGSTSADMYYAYTSAHSSLNSDDTGGSQSIYNTRAKDQFEAVAANNTYATSSDITPYVNGNGQAALPALDITSNSYNEYLKVVVPGANNGTITVTAQSTGLSSLDPKFWILYGPSTVKATATGPAGAYGATITATYGPVTAGQTYTIRVFAVSASPSAGGNYGLQVNFGSGAMSPFASPVVVVPSQPDQGGGTSSDHKIQTGSVQGHGDDMMVIGAPDPDAPAPDALPDAAGPAGPPAPYVGDLALVAAASVPGRSAAVPPPGRVAQADPAARLRAVDNLLEVWRRSRRLGGSRAAAAPGGPDRLPSLPRAKPWLPLSPPDLSADRPGRPGGRSMNQKDVGSLVF